MTNSTRTTKNYMAAGIAAFAAAISLSIAVQSTAPAPGIEATPMYEEVVVVEPTYVVVDRAPGAPMATAGLPVEAVVIEHGLTVEASRPSVVARASLRAPASQVQVMVHR